MIQELAIALLICGIATCLLWMALIVVDIQCALADLRKRRGTTAGEEDDGSAAPPA
ncbi:MAG TPA: hypothetical protein VNK04_05830 [Gemmataceae bacterium]|jgi:hypothetical protein|nr:hypothetical protein [Gemmataceae bacterium]